MGKRLKLFGIGSALAVPGYVILLFGIIGVWIVPWDWTLFLVIPCVAGSVLMLISADFTLRRFGRYMDSD